MPAGARLAAAARATRGTAPQRVRWFVERTFRGVCSSRFGVARVSPDTASGSAVGRRHSRCTAPLRRRVGRSRADGLTRFRRFRTPKDALEPHVSGLTLEVHYEKHHTRLSREAEEADRRQARGGRDPRAADPHRRRRRLRQRRAGVEPHLLLALHAAGRRRADRRAARAHRARVRRRRRAASAAGRDGRRTTSARATRGSCSTAGIGCASRPPSDAGNPLREGGKPHPDDRRLGARLLPRLPRTIASAT